MELRLDRLTKQYKQKMAVDRVDMELKCGVYGLLGANGAGKTTLMRMICDIQTPTSGEIFYNGQNIKKMGEEYRNVLGYLPQNFGYYPEFTAYKFLLYIASLKGLGKKQARLRALELLDMVGLCNERERKIKTLSGGMKQRLGIAQAMLNEPELLILDEPTAGLDPKERVRFRNLISSFSRNKIVLLSTHIVPDVEYIADEILVMKDGKFLHRGAPEVITREARGLVWECRVDSKDAVRYVEKYNVGNLKNAGKETVLRIISDTRPMEGAAEAEPTLEDLYLYYFSEEGTEQ
ncbi:MAG: ABC transporter ATP-binding protein [Lachnospiraceae bacterium]|nr:ABC transporter ATP-binding protein [Lachnospiraceae bacterium]